ncbi:sigma-70 family RNA polymerase sigma factor [Clostridium botulinum]|uniref:Sigma-70 family RNA polymerase sigma factor n=1 Tax=Clostridium botulinum TaxID=1491 RepID=A0A846J7C9_CLOBO|nr:sigma-70 family RNA polymerase sigma factor [Clostridium botulinum]ACA57441.1 putative RNA polymerase sigma factor [Clostridium botulinum A3 str. Loch Maree]NFH65495.1 sigma-70 family RNA polymerase sigma factor [Clostridium botulinum]NFJ09352.1 sigma-70 family RNA polymerase sigma factor [Clostridium botulinum]NFK16623.1 sigma-70 family RNA polymerase sigma factor [Clostridium botulinum]NFM94348.1 sigma-70 family RNA polymerase sigma factor [Clostridium botulinum]
MKKDIKVNKNNIEKLSFEEVLKKYSNLITKYAYKWIKYGFEDIKQIAHLAVWKAFNTYDISKNINFSTYANKIISTEILLHIRDNYQKGWEMDSVSNSLDNIIYNDGEKEQRFIDNIEDTNAEDELVNKSHINLILNKLPQSDKNLIIDYYLRDKSQTEIAIEREVSQTQICRKIKSILAYLKLREGTEIIDTKKEKQNNINFVNKIQLGDQLMFDCVNEIKESNKEIKKMCTKRKHTKQSKLEKILKYLNYMEINENRALNDDKCSSMLNYETSCRKVNNFSMNYFEQIKINI